MSSVSPSSSALNVDQVVAMPEFPFTGRIDPGEITPLQASVLIKYYDACMANFPGGVSSHSSVVSSQSSVVSGASSGRSRRQRRKRKAAQARRVSVVRDKSVGCGLCDSAVDLCGAPKVEDWTVSYVSVHAHVYEVPGLSVYVHKMTDGSCGFSKFSDGEDSVVQTQRNVVCADCRQFVSSCHCGKSSSYEVSVLVSRSRFVGLCDHVIRNPLRYGMALVYAFEANSGRATVPKLSIAEMEDKLGLVRDNSVDVKPVVEYGDGFCYVQLIKPQYRDCAAFRMQEWPLLRDLLRLPSDWYDMSAVNNLSLGKVADDKYHLVDTVGLPRFRDTCASVVRAMHDSAPGTLAHVALSWFAPKLLLDRPLASSSRVGGDLTLSQWLSELTEITCVYETSVVSKTAALLDGPMRRELKMLQALGDAGLSAAVAMRWTKSGKDVEDYQSARSFLTSNTALSQLYVHRVPQHFVSVAAGVNPGKGKVGASVIEAFLGLIFLQHGFAVLVRACENLGIFDFHQTGN